MSEIVAPNLIFPGLDFRAPPAPKPAVSDDQRQRSALQKQRERSEAIDWYCENVGKRPKPGRFKVTDLDDTVCHWPIGEAPGMLFCGEPKPDDDRIPYCGKHCRRAFNGTRGRGLQFRLADLSAR